MHEMQECLESCFVDRFGLRVGDERIDNEFEVAIVHNIIECIERQTDTVVRKSVLRVVVGSDFLRSVT